MCGGGGSDLEKSSVFGYGVLGVWWSFSKHTCVKRLLLFACEDVHTHNGTSLHAYERVGDIVSS